MKKSLLFRLAFCMFAFSLIMTSCSKEANTEVVEETVEPIKLSLLVTMNGETNEYDAYAAYCNVNGVEAVSISNNPDLLDNDLWSGTLAENDFLLHYRNDGTTTTTMGGAAFAVEFMGQQILSLVQDTEADVVIDEINSTYASGSLSGTFRPNPENFNETVSYSATFSAEVDPNKTPLFCY